MIDRFRLSYFFIALTVLVSHSSAAPVGDQKEKTSGEKVNIADVDKHDFEEEVKESIRKVVIGGKRIEYRATAGTMLLRDDKQDPKASIFYISYTRIDSGDSSRRPVTFSFNGGPGSSSVWLHLGLLGPRRVLLNNDGSAPPPPYELVDNEYSLLDKSDFVFIDPVSTGYSRAVSGEDPKQFHGFDADIKSVGEFIRLYITRGERWMSPKFLIGESYGTTRAAGLVGYLQDQHGINLNGIILVSSVLNFITTDFHVGNDLPFILFLPSFTATAWYHGKLGEDLQGDLKKALDEAESFAMGEYADALMKGDDVSDEKYGEVVRKLTRLTGLSSEYIEQTKTRIQIYRFIKELLRDERRTTGRLDSRFTGIDSDAAGEWYEYDPSYANIYGPFSATLNDYVRRELGFESDLPYEILTHKVHPWKFEKFQNRYLNVAETLRRAMTKNPHLKVFVANGYYDLATPYLATEYTFSHLRLDESLKNNVSMGYYEAGHMMYIHKESLARLKKDLVKFYDSAVRE